MADNGKIISIAHCEKCGKIMVKSTDLIVYCQNTSCSLFKKEYIIIPARLVEKREDGQNDESDDRQ